MDDLGIKQAAIIAATGASSGNVSGWVNEKAVPTYVNMGRLAKFLCVSPEFLTTYHGSQLSNTLANRIKFKIKFLNLNKGDVFGAMGVTYYIFTGWVKGKKIPSQEQLNDLAVLLETTPEWLMIGYGDMSAYTALADKVSDTIDDEAEQPQKADPTLKSVCEGELPATEAVDDTQYFGSLVEEAAPDDETEGSLIAGGSEYKANSVGKSKEYQEGDKNTDSDDDTVKIDGDTKKIKKAKKKAEKKAAKRKKAKRKQAKRKAQKELGIAQVFAIARMHALDHAHAQAQIDAQAQVQSELQAEVAAQSKVQRKELKAELKNKKKTKFAAVDAITPNAIAAESSAPPSISIAVEVPVFKLVQKIGKKSVTKKLKRTKKTVVADKSLFVLSQASPVDSICIYNKGWCISPDICNYDLCFADISKTEIKDGERYLFIQDGAIKIDHIKHDCDGGLLIGNTVPRHPDAIIAHDEVVNIEIIGWVYSINTTRAWGG